MPDPSNPPADQPGIVPKEVPQLVSPATQTALQPAAPYNPFGEAQKCWTNLDLKNPEHQPMVFRAYGEPDLRSDDVINQEIALHAVLIHPVMSVHPETGEEQSWDRTVLFLDDGSTVAFGSKGIKKMLAVLCAIKGPGPWNPPIRVRVKAIKLGSGLRTFTMELAEFAKRHP